MQEKYGFVYLWFDRIKGKFYIGCHWGTEDDGYICSSTWMRNAYRKRPQDFKRRILARVYTNRKDLFEEEFRFLNMIRDEELKVRYYNLSRIHPHHWSTDPEIRNRVKKTASETMKAKHQDPDYQKIYRAGRKKQSETMKQFIQDNPDKMEQRRIKMKATLAEKFPVEQRYIPTPKGTQENFDRISKGVRNYYDNMTPEQAERRKDGQKRTAEFHKGKRHRAGQSNTDSHNLKIAQANGKAVIIDGIEYHSKEAAGRSLNINGNTVGNRIKSDKYPTWSYKS